MSNIIEFPQTPRVLVTVGTTKDTGEPVYIFDHVDGHGRNNLATFKDERDVAIEAACLMAQGYDVVWDDPSKLLTLNDFDPRGAA